MLRAGGSESLDFLRADPTPVVTEPTSASAEEDRLPPSVVEDLMHLDGVDGVWIERTAAGARVVVLHYSRQGPTGHLPAYVQGMQTRVVGGEPIRAQSVR